MPSTPHTIDFDYVREEKVHGLFVWTTGAQVDKETLAEAIPIGEINPDAILSAENMPLMHKALYDYLVWLVRIQSYIKQELGVDATEVEQFRRKVLAIPDSLAFEHIQYVRSFQSYVVFLLGIIPNYEKDKKRALQKLSAYLSEVAVSFGQGSRPGSDGTMDVDFLHVQMVPWFAIDALGFPSDLECYILGFQGRSDVSQLPDYHTPEV
ncbi:hypothetical protein KC640_00875 [Candidatus Dojkabacteria bacterium]|uniref:Uncharacterized protein n=1 Tax=Candidatus Dojkabacteria bacterium TaxID=2099670 RepID=A0A955I6V9_9BACT|nr:hypothetical protein [Candidatus Dojkabacteria bacterium]